MFMHHRISIVLLLISSLSVYAQLQPQQQQQQQQRQRRMPEGIVPKRDLVYATLEDGQQMKLDLYLPEKATGDEPLIVWIHGGGWRNGSKQNVNPVIINLVPQGYAVASLDYRLGGLLKHPDHIHDCNAAIRWLKAHAGELGYSVAKVGVAGSSAGGHLALLVGVASDVPELQGKVGEHLDQSSRVDAIVDFYGPSDILALGKAKRGGQEFTVDEAFSKSASPVSYIDANDPPVLIYQGDADRTVVPQQSVIVDEMYRKLGLESTLHMLKGAGHGGPAFAKQLVHDEVAAFLKKHLKPQTQSDATFQQDTVMQAQLATTYTVTESASTPSLAVRRLHGLIWMAGTGRILPADTPQQVFDNALTRFKNNLKNNPHIDGVSFTGAWKDLEPKQGTFTFERLDAFVNAARDAKMPYKLVIIPGIGTPSDVFEQGAASINTKVANKYRPNFGEEVKVPIPWDPIFQDRFYKFVKVLSKRYTDDPLLVAVTVTVANFMSSETHLPRSASDMAQWQAASPDYAKKIETCWTDAFDRFAVFYPQQQLTLELANAVPGMDENLINIIKYGIAKHGDRFAVQNDQLSGKHDNMNLFSYRTITEFGPQVYHGFQTVAGWEFERSSERQGSMEQTAANFNKAQGKYLEIWYGDGANTQTCAKLRELVKFTP